MKANEAPEKIWIDPATDLPKLSGHIDKDSVEYIRKDAFPNTLKVKEVDLEKELESWRHNHFHGRRDKDASGEYLKRGSQLDLAKHFFELGLKVAQKGEET